MPDVKNSQQTVIGVDLGGTNVRAGLVVDGAILQQATRQISSDGSEDVVLEEIAETIQEVITAETTAVGIGVPSVVNVETGVVYNVENIPSWQEVHLKRFLEDRFPVTVRVNNDVNCFVLGEHSFGQGRNHEMERVGGRAAVCGRIGERVDHPHELGDGTRPPVRQHHRRCVFVRRPDVHRVNVDAVRKGLFQRVDTGDMRQNTQFNLAVVERQKNIAFLGDKGFADAATFFGSHGNVLQVWIGGGQTPCGRPGNGIGRVDPPGFGIDVILKRVCIC